MDSRVDSLLLLVAVRILDAVSDVSVSTTMLTVRHLKAAVLVVAPPSSQSWSKCRLRGRGVHYTVPFMNETSSHGAWTAVEILVAVDLLGTNLRQLHALDSDL